MVALMKGCLDGYRDREMNVGWMDVGWRDR